ncbi:hypothetical protein AVEN_257722-1 [Araneus ventricosus]|uniref:Uncharacterized protein n=1 Tax=Araneus ventricosus TaxID=182803 RepID=A0A4Y2LEM8_ARAVE|nr:hypothetical protein AVEN_257722-1 [Araneus ventricosus]
MELSNGLTLSLSSRAMRYPLTKYCSASSHMVPMIIQAPRHDCGICEFTIQPGEEPYVLHCGCTHHLHFLMNELEILAECPLCKEELVRFDVLILTAVRQFQAEQEMSSSS